MKRLLMAVALAASSLSMVSCAALQPPNSASLAVLDDKLLYAAEAAYNVPAFAYVEADSRNQIPDALKAQIKPKLQKLGVLLDKARAAHKLGNAVAFNASFDELKKLGGEITAALPK